MTGVNPLFPPKIKTAYPFAFINAPGCCGADIYWFPPKFPPGKIKKSIDLASTNSKRMVIVLGRHFPNFVEKICKGVGVITVEDHKLDRICHDYGYDRKGITQSNISNDLNFFGEAKVRYIYKVRAMSLGIAVTKLSDKVYYIDSLYNITENDVKGLIESNDLKKGDIIIATATSNQLKSQEALIKGGFRLVKKTNGTHGDYYTLGLYYYRKNR